MQKQVLLKKIYLYIVAFEFGDRARITIALKFRKKYIRTFQKNLCKYMNNPIQHASTTTLYYLLLCSSTIGKLLAIYRQFLLPPLATTIVLQGHPWQSVTLSTIISSKFVVSLSMFQGYGILSKHFLFKTMSHSLNSVYFSWPKI